MPRATSKPASAHRIRNEGVRVRQWRREQFYRLGFSNSDARTLSRSGADLTTTRELIAKAATRKRPTASSADGRQLIL